MFDSVKTMIAEVCENLRVTPWQHMWVQKAGLITLFACFLLGLVVIMTLRDRLAKRRKALSVLTYASLLISFVFVGLFLKAQPTTTNIVILLNGLKEGSVPIALFIMEPFIFLSFLFIGVTAIFWGRGAFCGWLCPYGAMTELLHRVSRKVVPRLRWTVPSAVHSKLIYVKYIVLGIIVGASFYSFMLSEFIAEVEPFKTFVLKLNRQWYFTLYFLITVAFSVVVYRAYCRYLCPLGAAISLPSFIKGLPLLKLRRHELCGTCNICARECANEAVVKGGEINNCECLLCLECQANYWDEQKCPGIKMERRREGAQQASLNQTPGTKSSTLSLLIVISALLLVAGGAEARTITVGPSGDYKSIASAVKAAHNGDVIKVAAGEYRERVRIDKSLNLLGATGAVLTGSGGVFIQIERRGVEVNGFTIKDDSRESDVNSAGIYIAKGADNAVVRNNKLYGVMHGIWSVSARNVTVERNFVEGKKHLERNYRGNGIYLTDSQEATVVGNTMDWCRDGIYLEVSHDGKIVGNETRNSRYAIHTMWADRSIFSRNTAIANLVGIAVMYSKQSEVTDNVVAGSQTHGLLLNQTTRSKIAGNTLIGNTKGIFYYNSVFNTLTSNLIMNNSLGLHNTGGSWDNVVEKNSFINNEVQVKFIAGRNQEWTGNYWSDYLGWDMTGKGTGDLPYETNSVVDHILWRYPAAKLLYASPSFQALWMMEKQFPLLKVPRVVDPKPAMQPLHDGWKQVLLKYPFSPARYYGDIDKLAVAH